MQALDFFTRSNSKLLDMTVQKKNNPISFYMKTLNTIFLANLLYKKLAMHVIFIIYIIT